MPESSSAAIGLSGAAILDPINNTQENVLGTFGTLFATTLFLAVDGHIVAQFTEANPEDWSELTAP